MKLYQETRLQAWMLVISAILLIVALGLLIVGQSLSYLLGAGGIFIIAFIIIAAGQRRSQVIMDRMAKIREGSGDKADLEWLKTRNK